MLPVWNLWWKRWRAAQAQERRASRDFQDGFAMLDLDGGAPWSLLTQLVTYAPNKRLSADAALRHPAFGGKLGAAEWLPADLAPAGPDRWCSHAGGDQGAPVALAAGA